MYNPNCIFIYTEWIIYSFWWAKKVTGKKVTEKKSQEIKSQKKVTIINDQENMHISVHKCYLFVVGHDFHVKRLMMRKFYNQNETLLLKCKISET